MTSYWKPRWENTVLFGTYKDLPYRLDIMAGKGLFRIRTKSGPGITVDLSRDGEEGFKTVGELPDQAKKWIEEPGVGEALAGLMSVHFSRIEIRPAYIECHCRQAADDILPETTQLSWCLKKVYEIWEAAPENERRWMDRSSFMA